MTRRLWPEALSTQNLGQVAEYITSCIKIPDCKGSRGGAVSDGVWYRSSDSQPEDVICCEACYEDRVAGSPFVERFVRCASPQREDKIWSCDLCLPFISRALELYAKSNNWLVFRVIVEQRLHLPVCEGKAVNTSTRRWYRTRHLTQALWTCEGCYLDKSRLPPSIRSSN